MNRTIVNNNVVYISEDNKGEEIPSISCSRGRPRKYNSETLKEYIDNYFNHCDSNSKKVITKDGDLNEISFPIPYTIEGLAAWLDIDIDTLRNYGKRPGNEDLFGIIKSARQRIAENISVRALSGANHATFSMFNLKCNFGYKDEHSVNVKSETIINNLSKEQIIDILSE